MIVERRLTPEEREEIVDAAGSVALPDLDALDELVAQAREEGVDDELLFHLGAWWGEQVREAAGWLWVHLTLGEALEAPALVSEDRGVACLPLQLVAGVLDGSHDPVLRTILERLQAGERPRGAPKSYAIVG